MSHCKDSHKVYSNAREQVCGRMIGAVFLLACTFFAAVSGSSPATVVAVGTIMIAGMVNAGYPKKFAAGILCNAGTLGILIPPSIVMVVYCAVTEQSVGRIFLAGILPGLLLSIMMMISIPIFLRHCWMLLLEGYRQER